MREHRRPYYRLAAASVIAALACGCSLIYPLGGFTDDGSGDTGADARMSTTDATSSDDGSALDTGAVVDAGDADLAGPNFHPQGTFESGSCDPWDAFNGNASITNVARTGAHACQFCTKPFTNPADFTADDNGVGGPDVVGTAYRARGWVRTAPGHPAPAKIQLVLRSDKSNPSFMDLEANSSPVLTPLTDSWVQLESSLTITKSGGTINIYVAAPQSAGACFLLDDVVLQKLP